MMKFSEICLAFLAVALTPLSFAQPIPQGSIQPPGERYPLPPVQNPRHHEVTARQLSPSSALFKATGSVDTAWVRHLGDSTRASAMDVDARGNVYVAGYDLAGHAGAAKFRTNGELAWIAQHGGSDSVLAEGEAIQSTPNGEAFAATSFWNSKSFRYKDTAVTIKYDSTGAEQWASPFIVPGDPIAHISALCLDGEGNIFVTGTITSVSKIATVKYDEAGKILWARSYHNPNQSPNLPYPGNNGVAVKADANGNSYVMGEEHRSSMPVLLHSSYVTIKYNSEGDTLWTRAYRERDLNSAAAMAIDAGGNVYVTGRARYGYTELTGSYVGGGFGTIKYSPSGDTLWIRLFTDAQGATSLTVDSSGDVYVSGYALTNSGTIYDPVYHGYIVTVKYNSEGDTLWTRRYPGPWTYNYRPPEYKSAICLDRNGNVYVAGSPSFPSNAPPGLVTIKYSSSGDEEWTALYPPGSAVVGVQLDISDNAYVVCTTGTEAGPTQSTVIKYVQSPTSVRNLESSVPTAFALEQNYPNPFNPKTGVRFQVSGVGGAGTRGQGSGVSVKLVVYELLGREVAVLVNERKMPGTYEVSFDGSNLSSGVYFYRMTAGSFTATRKLLLLK